MSIGGTSVSGEPSVLVSLGSNVRPEENLETAVRYLGDLLAVTAASRVFRTRAVAERSMPDFLNAAVEIRTRCPAAELKYGVFRELEWRLGRRRTDDRNAPRPIDLDVALYADCIVESEPLGLVIPDPEILTRAHVALPLADLAPDRRHPVTGDTLATIAERVRAESASGTVRMGERCDVLRELLAAG